MMRSALFVLLLVGVGCDRSKPAERDDADSKPVASAEHKDEPLHQALPTKLRLSEQVIADARIETSPAAKAVLAITLALPGEVSVDPDKNAKVASAVAGRLSRVLFKEGDHVKKGDVLASVRIPDLAKLRAAHAAAVSKAASARTNATRLDELAQKGLTSNQELLNAKAEADSLEAEVRALEQELRSLGMGTSDVGGSELSVRAPIAGTVISRAAVVGQPVTTEDVIANIADLSEVWFLGRVFEKDLAEMAVGARAEVQLNAFPKHPFNGAIEYIGRQIDPVARTVTARIRLTNDDDLLRLGLFGTAHVEVGAQRRQPVLVVPRSAVTEISGKSVVFVREPDGDFELHELSLGEASLGKVEVLSGLREGEAVVVDGAFTLKSALLRSSAGEDD